MNIIQDACICCTEYRAAIRAEPCGHWISCGPCFVNIFEVVVFLSLKPQNPPFRTRWKTRTQFPHAYFVGHLWRVSRTDENGCVGSRGSTINSTKCTDYPMEVGGYILSRKNEQPPDYFFGERFNERPVTIRTENIMAEEDWIRMGRPYVNKEIVTGNTCSSSKSTESYMVRPPPNGAKLVILLVQTIGSFGHSTIGNTNDSTCTQSTHFSTITSKSLWSTSPFLKFLVEFLPLQNFQWRLHTASWVIYVCAFSISTNSWVPIILLLKFNSNRSNCLGDIRNPWFSRTETISTCPNNSS